MTAVRVEPSWLALREPADAAARAADLVDELRAVLPAERPLAVHDLACGTGAMMRWLAPRLPGTQHWTNYDVDADLLAAIGGGPSVRASDGATVTFGTRRRDVTRLPSGELSDAALITSSALLNLLTMAELDGLAAACAAAHCPILLSLTVTGTIRLWPPHPLDEAVTAAFHAHQRRTVRGAPLLGAESVEAAGRLFGELGRTVLVRDSPWQLGTTSQALIGEWLSGWLAAACEQDPHLAKSVAGYAHERIMDAEAGRLRLLVQHQDMLILPTARPAHPVPLADIMLDRRSAADG